ncbi:uncharacterized protein LOC142518527 [Primulina tabacum]|uniref:uncharacterized protein LOC142518527 n=1 Tax=Primulina tabacum TaxID=48773 RepID=UPI003F59577C
MRSSRRIAPRIERKITEKNRRNGIKILCSQLLSLLLDDTSQNLITSTSDRPLLEVQEMGPKLDVVVPNEVDGYSRFHRLVKLLRRHGSMGTRRSS